MLNKEPSLKRKSNQTARLRLVPRFGDLAMILQFIRSKIWQQFYSGDKNPYWAVFVWVLSAKIEMFALVFRAVLRYDHGRHTTGIIMGLWSAVLVMAFNAEHMVAYLAGFVPFIAPACIFFITPSEFFNHLAVDIRSPLLCALLTIFTVVQSVHVFRIYAKQGNTDDHMKRGSSWLYKALPRNTNLPEYYVQWLAEPLLVFSLGYAAWIAWGDLTFFAFCGVSALCLWLQESADGLYRYYHEVKSL